MAHGETHRTEHIGWLRAAVLGANDGLISTSSLVVGVAAAQSQRAPILLAATAGLVAGALSMAAGEYVSVSSQSDTEQADLALERRELAEDPEFELAELAADVEPARPARCRSARTGSRAARRRRTPARLRASVARRARRGPATRATRAP